MYLTIDVEDPSVGTDVDGPSTREPQRTEHAVGSCNSRVRVAQYRKLDPHRGRECPVRLHSVATGGEHRRVEAFQCGVRQPDGSALDGASAGERLRKPGHDNRRSTCEIGQAIASAVGPREREIWRAVARRQFDAGPKPPATEQIHHCRPERKHQRHDHAQRVHERTVMQLATSTPTFYAQDPSSSGTLIAKCVCR